MLTYDAIKRLSNYAAIVMIELIELIEFATGTLYNTEQL